MGQVLDCSSGGGAGRWGRLEWEEELTDIDEHDGHVSDGHMSEGHTSDDGLGERISRGGVNSYPLPYSPIWAFQKEFYRSKGVDCWKHGLVPSFASSNSFLAARYARVIVDFMQGVDKKLYIVELGSGSGKLGYQIVKRVTKLREILIKAGGGQELNFVYILTDFYREIVDFWLSHPPLKEMIQKGWMDVAVLDGQTKGIDSIRLEASGQVLYPRGQPLVFICNYLFDSLVQDAFQIRDDRLFRAKVEICSVDTHNGSLLVGQQNAYLSWSYDLCDPKEDLFLGKEMLPWGSQEERDALVAILRSYTQAPVRAKSIVVPLGALRLIRNMVQFSSSPAETLVLSGDKGFHSVSGMDGSHENPQLAIHGSFSFMTNFHLIREFIKRVYPNAFCSNDTYEDGFKVFATIFDYTVAQYRCKTSIYSLVSCFSPEQFSSLQAGFQDDIANLVDLNPALALLRLARHDSSVFLSLKKLLIDKTPHATLATRRDLEVDLACVDENYYPLQPSKDARFELARVEMALRHYDRALSLFESSLIECGEHHVTYLNIGICQFYTGDPTQAGMSFKHALRIDPSFERAQHWIEKLQNSTL
mmetsp:Transcript_12169/g.19778  ORF Transcript_12169/g.19778 Transcript_12169/m.19778 type:complete len:588 (+) Transcript_12169:582-2345(+)|eukprot:CAMPEP_0203752562 /NCGR_PEP_ID=MMETSP0098-20131031/6469_1 /ASSEMBLY_ACC=CAM_ASM_000208 /TAXON_ID=96639 /ORGANISM=" , Strain NY0313808BC1" /LENGTH=587 /DNA_ID=CAMNT_0050642789 /DNA_START=672 /DNA_END=2435 /DNA_ORIENTATION=-